MGGGGSDEFDEDWEVTVLQDHALWKEYGCPIDPRTLPKKQFQAHLAILQGKGEKRREQNEENERKAEKAEREAKKANK